MVYDPRNDILLSSCDLVKSPILDQDESVEKAAKVLTSNGVKQIIVIEEDLPVGVLTLTDIVYKLVAKKKSPSKTKISAICSKKIFYLTDKEYLSKAYMYMLGTNHLFCPVVSNGKFKGLITFSEAVKRLNKK